MKKKHTVEVSGHSEKIGHIYLHRNDFLATNRKVGSLWKKLDVTLKKKASIIKRSGHNLKSRVNVKIRMSLLNRLCHYENNRLRKDRRLDIFVDFRDMKNIWNDWLEIYWIGSDFFSDCPFKDGCVRSLETSVGRKKKLKALHLKIR